MLICDRCRKQTEGLHRFTVACAGNTVCDEVCDAAEQVYELCRDCCGRVRSLVEGGIGRGVFRDSVWGRLQALSATDPEQWRTVREWAELVDAKIFAVNDNFYTRHSGSVEKRLREGTKGKHEWRLLPNARVAPPEPGR